MDRIPVDSSDEFNLGASMLRRFILIWLMLSIFGYGMALAADLHGELSADMGISLDSTGDEDGSHDDTGCHHCSHGTSHLLGLNTVSCFNIYEGGKVLASAYRVSFDSFSPPSLLRPPISI